MNKTMSNTVHDLLKHQEDSNFQVDMTGEGGKEKKHEHFWMLRLVTKMYNYVKLITYFYQKKSNPLRSMCFNTTPCQANFVSILRNDVIWYW